jgi:CRISPR/Cas system-associated endonuclease Cas1
MRCRAASCQRSSGSDAVADIGALSHEISQVEAGCVDAIRVTLMNLEGRAAETCWSALRHRKTHQVLSSSMRN